MSTLVQLAAFKAPCINHREAAGSSPYLLNHLINTMTTWPLSLAHPISQRDVLGLKAFHWPSLVFELILSGSERES